MIDAFEEAIREEAADIIGREMSDDTWAEMYGRAKRKLQHIISLYGDDGGARNTVNYIAQLVAEAVRAQAFTDYTTALWETKRMGADTNADPQGHTNIIPQNDPKSQAICGVTA